MSRHTESWTFATSVADAHGRFDLGGLEPGEYSVRAAWPGGRERLAGSLRAEHVKTGNRSVEIVVARPATLTGRVLLDGVPLQSFGLLLTSHPEYPFAGVADPIRTNDGRFVLRDVEPGTWGLVVVGPRTGRKIIEKIVIEAGKAVDLGDIAMPHGLRITGHVRDAGGPVAGATLAIGRSGLSSDSDPPQQKWVRGEFETTTDASGAYVFDGVAPWSGKRPARIVALHPDHGSTSQTVPDHDATIDLVLQPAGGIDGTVEGLLDRFGMVVVEHDGVDRSRSVVRVNASGGFHVDGLPPGNYVLSMPSPEHAAPTPVSVTVLANQRVKAKLMIPNAAAPSNP
jgi:protocatechuate 3,4-dioxygenase beta subunit